MRGQKGITLVALIITIIVLLILAVVAIGTINNTGIMDKANTAKTEYMAAQGNEQNTINAAEGYMNNAIASVVQ